jgi:hypothetical protein
VNQFINQFPVHELQSPTVFATSHRHGHAPPGGPHAGRGRIVVIILAFAVPDKPRRREGVVVDSWWVDLSLLALNTFLAVWIAAEGGRAVGRRRSRRKENQPDELTD